MSHVTNGLRAATAAALMGSFALAASGTATADPVPSNSAADIKTLAGSLAKGYSLSNCQPAALDKMTYLTLAELDCDKTPTPADQPRLPTLRIWRGSECRGQILH